MSKKSKIELLQIWEKSMFDSTKALDPVIKCLDLPPECPLLEAFWNLQTDFTQSISREINGGDWLEWYWIENDMGKRRLRAGKDWEMKKIKNIEDLLWLIERD